MFYVVVDDDDDDDDDDVNVRSRAGQLTASHVTTLRHGCKSK